MCYRKGLVLLKAGCHSPRGFTSLVNCLLQTETSKFLTTLHKGRDVERSLCPCQGEQPSQARLEGITHILPHAPGQLPTSTPAQGLRTHLKKLYSFGTILFLGASGNLAV